MLYVYVIFDVKYIFEVTIFRYSKLNILIGILISVIPNSIVKSKYRYDVKIPNYLHNHYTVISSLPCERVC